MVQVDRMSGRLVFEGGCRQIVWTKFNTGRRRVLVSFMWGLDWISVPVRQNIQIQYESSVARTTRFLRRCFWLPLFLRRHFGCTRAEAVFDRLWVKRASGVENAQTNWQNVWFLSFVVSRCDWWCFALRRITKWFRTSLQTCTYIGVHGIHRSLAALIWFVNVLLKCNHNGSVFGFSEQLKSETV